jgi:hypothetical protein
MGRNIDRSAVTTDRADAFATGRTRICGPSGGKNSADDDPPYPTVSGGDALNGGRSRLASASEKHYNGGNMSIRNGEGIGKGSQNVNPR